MAAVAIVPAAPRATIDVCRVNVTGADVNDAAAYDAAKYPTEPEKRYYLSFEKDGVAEGKSQVFGVAADGSFEFNSYIFPVAGTYSVVLRDTADDSSVATASATVS